MTEKILLVLLGAFLSSIAWLFKQHWDKKKAKNERRRVADLETLANVRSYLPETYAKSLDDLDAYSGIPTSAVHALQRFNDAFKDERRPFHDAKLSEKIVQTHRLTRALAEKIAQYTIPSLTGSGYTTVHPAAPHTEKKRFAAEAQELWKDGQELKRALLEFYDLAKSKLDT